MNRFLLATALVVLSTSFTGCTPTPSTPPQGPGGIRINNVNGDADRPNEQIRLWVLTEAQIRNPPTTKAQAELLDNGGYVIPRFRAFTFRRPPGTYYLVASNQNYYQNLGPMDPFLPGEGYTFAEIQVANSLVPVEVFNTNRQNRLPQIRLR